MSCMRQSSGSGAAIMPARSTPSSAMMLSTRVGELNGHHGVGLQPERTQPGGERRNGAVGLRIGEPARRPAGQALAIGRIDQRQRVGVAHAGAAEQVVERGAVAVGLFACRSKSFGVPMPPGFRQIAEQRGL